MMKPVMLIAAVATLSTPALAQLSPAARPIATTPVWTAATLRALDNQDADSAAAADIARVRPVSDTVTTTDIPASQLAPAMPAPSVTASAPDNIGG